MNEIYNLPIKFTEEERKKYELWGLKEAKFSSITSILIIIIAILITLYKYSIVFGFYKSDYWQYKLEIWQLTGQNGSIAKLFTSSFFLDIILIIVCVLFSKFMDLIFKVCYKPINQKHIEIKLILTNFKAEIKVLENNKILSQETIDLNMLKDNLILENNSIKIKNSTYKIGINNKQNIYAKPEKHFSEPTLYKNSVSDISHFSNVVTGLINSLEEKQKEAKWNNN